MKRRNRWAAVVIGVAGLCAVAMTAAADTQTRGFGIVMSRDVARSTLEIGNTVFKVTPQTVFKDAEGNPTTFAGLAIFDVHQGLFSLDEATKVAWVGVSDSEGTQLQSVVVIKELPN